jgi:hypothetical protein
MVRYYGHYSNVSRGNGRRKVWMTPFPASSILRETKRLSGKAGRG